MKYLIKKLLNLLIGFLIILGSLSFNYPHLKDETVNPEITENFESRYFSRKNITDGPYIFYDNDIISIKWIHRNRLDERNIRGNNFKVIKQKFGFDFNPDWIEQCDNDSINYIQDFSGVENLIAISDIHGQYEVLVKLLKEHHVIDKNFNWIFGKGHLVILGDVLDRGPNVTEALWLIFRLEQQAKKSGGMVHVLLGNHEMMVLNNDIRYTHEKYITTAQLMAKTYTQLYSEDTFFGKWLRKKPVIVTINDMLFVHAGISMELINKGLTAEDVNSIFINDIIGKSWDTILKDSVLSFMRSNKGPVWYRGYFEDPNLTDIQVDRILQYFDTNHIIVGHTSMPNIVSLFHGKIFGIDSSIKFGDYGEALIYQNGEYYRGTVNGTLIKL
ncbi:MAG: metallophosphoesterase [Bacteroidales bacterium]|nr:metallophosphoesterase [Bacteroidales bacterium]